VANIVLGLGTSHSPQLSFPADKWADLGRADEGNQHLLDPEGQPIGYTDLLKQADPAIAAEELSVEVFRAKFDRLQRGLKQVSETLAQAAPDIVIVVGDDQEENIGFDNMPPLLIYTGESIPSVPRIFTENPFPTIRMAAWSYGSEERSYPVASDLSTHLISYLTEADFDVAQSRFLREGMGMGHAFAFMYGRIFEGRIVPIVPIMVNTDYGPNQPTPRRCYELGRAIRRGVEAWPSDARVAIVGSGGLSHFVINEDLDRRVLDAMAAKDTETICSIPRPLLNSGNSEIRNWLVAAGAADDLAFELIDYVPCYRSPAGTGGGWAFARWTKPSEGAR
jgi:3-O-methylgallate 3,4-dioxygenase